MIDISFEKNPILYQDFEECLSFLSNIKEENYSYPNEITNFHIYTEVKTPKELMVVKSYLATQDLEKTKLTIWSDYDIKDTRFIKDFQHLVELKVYNPAEEAKGTILENRKDILSAGDYKHYLQSDLFRILVCTKYGGIFADMDIVFLRNFLPILDQEFLYMWGGETDFANEGACATVMSLKKDSELGNRMLSIIDKIPFYPNSVCWGKDMFARLYRENPNFTIFPSSFFNTEWCVSKKYKELTKKIQDTWFDGEVESEDWLFLDAFAWHWHNTTWKLKKPKKGSKFYRLEEIVDQKLKQKNII